MQESPAPAAVGRADVAPGAIAWLDVSAEAADRTSPRPRTGPLGLRIAPLRPGRAPFFFRGARLRGTRCVWSASTVGNAELTRPARTTVPAPFDTSVQILARVECDGPVFDALGTGPGTLRVVDPRDELTEVFPANTHLFTLTAPLAVIGLEPSALAGMQDHVYPVSSFQLHLLRAAAGLLLAGGDDLDTSAALVGVDRYLAALGGLLLRTSVARPGPDLAHVENIRMRTDAIIYEQSSDPALTPAVIAAQLNISLRQLYRAFTGTESPAARIRRRRLERAAEILAARTGPGQVERVAVECGFASAEYFSRAFRKEFGLSPRAYRSARRDTRRRREVDAEVTPHPGVTPITVAADRVSDLRAVAAAGSSLDAAASASGAMPGGGSDGGGMPGGGSDGGGTDGHSAPIDTTGAGGSITPV